MVIREILAMPNYRCYLLDRHDRIQIGTTYSAKSDQEALAAAEGMLTMSPALPAIEVWEGTRIVGRVRFKELGS